MEKRKILSICSEYCCGCGLCRSVNDVQFTTDEKGFDYPLLSEKDADFCKNVCPSGGMALKNADGSIWGIIKESYLGWSSDEEIRFQASSGGVITSLLLSLQEMKKAVRL